MNDQLYKFQDFIRKLKHNCSIFIECYKVVLSLINKLSSSLLDFARVLHHKQGDIIIAQVLKDITVED